MVNSKRALDSATGAMAVLAEHLLPVRQVSRKFGDGNLVLVVVVVDVVVTL